MKVATNALSIIFEYLLSDVNASGDCVFSLRIWSYKLAIKTGIESGSDLNGAVDQKVALHRFL
jgi:hypothetical protein